MNDQSPLHAHISAPYSHAVARRNMGDMSGQIINAASQTRAVSNGRHGTHLKLTFRLSSLASHQVCTYSAFLSWNPSQYVCFGGNVWEAGGVKGWERLWLKGCIDRLESTGTNLCCITQYNSGQTGERGWAWLWVHEYTVSVYVGVWFDVCWEVVEYSFHTASPPAEKTDRALWLNHFTQWRVLKDTPRPQLRP